MKFNLIHTVTIYLILIGIISCDDPVPTELTPAENTNAEFEMEIVSSNPNEFVYENGYDSTGVTEPVPQRSSYILLNGIKTTYKQQTYKSGTGTAVFFDPNEPIFNSTGRLVGYKARALGKVYFDRDSALINPLIIKYIDKGVRLDTLAGFRHYLRFDSRRMNAPKEFPYNKSVLFRLDKFIGTDVEFEIMTPEEVTGRININGSIPSRNLNIEINWNRSISNTFEVVLGGVLKNNGEILPLIKFKTRDNGFIRIPFNVLKSVPFEKFDSMIITLIRRYKIEIPNDNLLVNNFIASQSIHNIIFDVP